MTWVLNRQLRVRMLRLTRKQRWIIFLLALCFSLALLTTFWIVVLYHKVPEEAGESMLRIFSKSADLHTVVLKRSNPEIDFRKEHRAITQPFNSLELEKTNATKGGEEFTVVILTHQRRKSQLPGVLKNLIGLQRLRAVIVIWNGEKPTEDIILPRTPFPVKVLTSKTNSMNNRFLPLEIIETDAVLNMDDDMFPSQENLMFAFRIWQDYRERIVGFPGRGVLWANGHWVYDGVPHSISMVLIGLAFYHKKYMSLYTYEMPAVIRERVDNVTNCDDIAINFLVSHITQKAPIKVTATNEWSCSGCKTADDSLWMDPKHFVERDACINFFAEVYGYIPLFKAEYRLDDLSSQAYQTSVPCIPVVPALYIFFKLF